MSRLFRFHVAAWLLASAFALPSVASAQNDDQRGRVAFERGAAAYDAGRFQEALDAFTEAFALTERPQLQYNIGLAQDRLRMDGAALSSFEAYLAAVPDSPYREQVTSRIEALRAAEARRSSERTRLEAERAEAEAEAVKPKRSRRTTKKAGA